MIIWRPFMRQMREIGETRSILGLAFDNEWQEPLNGFAANSHGRCIWSFARLSLNVKVKSQKSRSPGTKNELCTHKTPAVWTEWNAVVAGNVAQAADATIRSLRRVTSPACVRWAWRATAGLCHAFLVFKRHLKTLSVHS